MALETVVAALRMVTATEDVERNAKAKRTFARHAAPSDDGREPAPTAVLASRAGGLATWGVLALAVTGAVTAAARRDVSIGVRSFFSLGHLLLGGLGLAAAIAFLAIALVPSLGAHPAVFVLVRTLSLVGGTLAFALAQRYVGNHELCWAAFVFLGLAFAKLLAQDLPQGNMFLLVVAFSTFGGVTIALPRLLRRPASPATSILHIKKHLPQLD